MKTNLLDNIKIASPCSADWQEMYGDDQKRYCSYCKLNVYNLSEMTRAEAEKFLFEAEGRICVRLYKRSDGTVITQDCPVGWAKVKQKVSKAATAVFSLIVGFFGGFFGVYQTSFDNSNLLEDVTVEKENLKEKSISVEEGGLSYEKPITMMGVSVSPKRKKENNKSKPIVCRFEKFRDLQDEPVELWIK